MGMKFVLMCMTDKGTLVLFASQNAYKIYSWHVAYKHV